MAPIDGKFIRGLVNNLVYREDRGKQIASAHDFIVNNKSFNPPALLKIYLTKGEIVTS